MHYYWSEQNLLKGNHDIEKPEKFVNEEYLKGVNTKWMMSNYREKPDMNIFYGNYLFGIHDIVYEGGKTIK